MFSEKYLKETGQDVRFRLSFGGSGTQARAVIDGLPADVVALALPLGAPPSPRPAARACSPRAPPWGKAHGETLKTLNQKKAHGEHRGPAEARRAGGTPNSSPLMPHAQTS